MSEFSRAVARVDLDAQTQKLRERVSPSQVETWDQCNRKWTFAYIFGMKTPSSASQEAGTELHAECEHTSNTRGEVRESRWKAVVQKALSEGLILIGDHIKNEQWVEIPTYPDGPTMRGKYDAVDFSLSVRTGYVGPSREGVMGDVLTRLVNDYKSTKDFRWNKTPSELAKNIQLSTYGRAVLQMYPEDTHITLRHTYLRTQGAAAVAKSEVVLPRARISSNWTQIKERIRGMQDLVMNLPRQEQAIAEVSPNLSQCNAFGGCPYLPLCGLGSTTFSFAGGVEPPKEFSFEDHEKEETKMGLLEDLMNGVTPKEDAPPAPAPPVETKTDVCSACGGKRYVKDTAKDALFGSYVPCKACGARSVTPPDQPPRDSGKAPPVAEAAPATEKKRGRPKKEAAPEPSMKIFVEEDDGTRREITEDEKEEAATAREGLADEAERILKNPAPESDGGPSDGEVRLAEKIVEATKKTKPAKEGVAIYVDCLPVKGTHSGEGIDYLEWLAPVAERVARDKKVADWRIIPFSAEGELAAEIHATIKKSGLPPVVLVSGNSRARAPFLEVAGMFAATVTVAVGR